MKTRKFKVQSNKIGENGIRWPVTGFMQVDARSAEQAVDLFESMAESEAVRQSSISVYSEHDRLILIKEPPVVRDDEPISDATQETVEVGDYVLDKEDRGHGYQKVVDRDGDVIELESSSMILISDIADIKLESEIHG